MDNMKDTEYYKSGKHKTNVLIAQKKSIIKNKLLKQERIELYNENPNKCAECNSSIIYSIKGNKCCCRRCAAIYTNKKRGKMPDKVKTKISKSLMGRKTQSGNGRTYCKIVTKECVVCSSEFSVGGKRTKNKTCTKRCATIASTKFRTYQNGSRKTTWFFNPNENKDVLLESSWEVRIAELLVSKDIIWTRPEPMDWIDSTGKERLYYPDFYLVDYDVYLDPKNPYCMEQDKEKMKIVSREMKLIFGDIKLVEDYVVKLCVAG